MFCPNCGKANPDDSRFCESCGTILNDVNSGRIPVAPAYPSPPVQPAYQPAPPPPVYNNSPVYTAAPQPVYNSQDNSPLSVGQYVGMMILGGLPVIGFILLLVWAFGSDTNLNKKNYAKAILIVMLIAIAVSIVLTILLGGVFAALFSSMSDYSSYGY